MRIKMPIANLITDWRMIQDVRKSYFLYVKPSKKRLRDWNLISKKCKFKTKNSKFQINDNNLIWTLSHWASNFDVSLI